MIRESGVESEEKVNWKNIKVPFWVGNFAMLDVHALILVQLWLYKIEVK